MNYETTDMRFLLEKSAEELKEILYKNQPDRAVTLPIMLELWNRKQDEQAKQMLLCSNEMRKLTRWIVVCTVVITLATILQLII